MKWQKSVAVAEKSLTMNMLMIQYIVIIEIIVIKQVNTGVLHIAYLI